MEELQEQNRNLIEQLELEKQIQDQEIAQVVKAYQEKFIALKEHESINELQLNAAQTEGLISDQLLWDIKEQKTETVNSLKAEVARLRKLVNSRQKDVLEMRKNVALFYKKAKESQLQKE